MGYGSNIDYASNSSVQNCAGSGASGQPTGNQPSA
jgi:hypothetical protein